MERVRELLQEKEKSGEMQNEGEEVIFLDSFSLKERQVAIVLPELKKNPDATIVSLEEKETSPQKKEKSMEEILQKRNKYKDQTFRKTTVFLLSFTKMVSPRKEKVLLFSLVQKEGEMDILESETSSFDL